MARAGGLFVRWLRIRWISGTNLVMQFCLNGFPPVRPLPSRKMAQGLFLRHAQEAAAARLAVEKRSASRDPVYSVSLRPT